MISNYLGHILDRPLSPLARRISIHPNTVTVTGFIVTAVAAYVLTRNLVWGGILMLFGGLFDMFDGIIARVNGRATTFGAYLDSVLDRYSDSFLLVAFTWVFYSQGSPLGMFLSMGTLAGSLIISYARARAEGLGKNCQTGVMERPERIILMIIASLTGYLLPIMWVLFVFTHVTVLQRIYHVWKVVR